jgi:hypothetical protein
MRQRTITITTCQLKLGEPQQCILGLRSKRIIHDNVPVIALGIGGIRCQAGTPEERLRVQPS